MCQNVRFVEAANRCVCLSSKLNVAIESIGLPVPTSTTILTFSLPVSQPPIIFTSQTPSLTQVESVLDATWLVPACVAVLRTAQGDNDAWEIHLAGKKHKQKYDVYSRMNPLPAGPSSNSPGQTHAGVAGSSRGGSSSGAERRANQVPRGSRRRTSSTQDGLSGSRATDMFECPCKSKFVTAIMRTIHQKTCAVITTKDFKPVEGAFVLLWSRKKGSSFFFGV
jgi:hypothetical protein